MAKNELFENVELGEMAKPLHVDDSESNENVIRAILEGLGYNLSL